MIIRSSVLDKIVRTVSVPSRWPASLRVRLALASVTDCETAAAFSNEEGMKARREESHEELRPEYDFDYSKAVRGKYYKPLLEEGSNVVVLEPDVARAFHGSAAVNEALRSLLDLTRSTQRLTRSPSGRAKSARR